MKLKPDELLKLLSDTTRLRSLMLLLNEGELCVCELTHALGEIQPKISRHLAALRDSQVVMDRRSGQWIYYRINPGLPAWAVDVLNATLAGMKGDKRYLEDARKLKSMPNRPENRICV
jgi:ArsR family transcriptional regulator